MQMKEETNNAGTSPKEGGIWGIIDRIQGDKVIWIILSILILFSIVSIFSSTTLLANEHRGTSRVDIFIDQLKIVLTGIIVIFVCYKIPYIKLFRILSKYGFAVSLVLLTCLVLDIRAVEANEAKRSLDLWVFDVHVYEVTKVAMIMYLAWAVHAFENDSFRMVGRIAEKIPKLAFLEKPGWKLWIYIYIPILTVCVLIFAGSASSALFIGGIMVLTILAGGIKFREILKLLPLMAAALAVCIFIWSVSGGKTFKRVGTALSRTGLTEIVENVTGKPVVSVKSYNDRTILELDPDSEEFNKAVDAIRQPESAKIAIHEGGIFGKGPGGSTQKYTVALIFSDYMYSFIVEEYGLWGGILIIILYISLLARATIIVKCCDNVFAKTAVAGLSMLITGQALMHIYINLDMGLLTGQTLPLISHGKSSFLCFCVAFGIILSISKMTRAKIQKATEKAKPIGMEPGPDDPQAGLQDLEDFESGKIIQQ